MKKNNNQLKHFGILVPESEIKWVKKAYYHNLPKSYTKARKKQVKANIYKLEGELLEEKARKWPILNIWYHWVSRLIINFMIILFSLFLLIRDIAKVILISSFNFATIMFLVLLARFIIKIKFLEPFMNKYNRRKSARARRLLKWQKSRNQMSENVVKEEIIHSPDTPSHRSADIGSEIEMQAESIPTERKYKKFAKVIDTLKFLPKPWLWIILFLIGLWLIVTFHVSEIWENAPKWFTEFEYLAFDNRYIWIILYIIFILITIWFGMSINRCEHTFGELPMFKKIIIIAILSFALGAIYRIIFHFFQS